MKSARAAALLILLGLGLLLVPLAAEAQQAGKVPRIGLVFVGHGRPEPRHLLDPFKQGLSELGYREGQNIVLERRYAESQFERLPQLLADLTRLKVDVLVVGATPSALAAKRATNTIPIVVAAMADPVKDGLVASLARPGGNVTGFTFLAPELVPKRLELLKAALPEVSRVAALWHPGAYGEATMRDMVKATTEGAAQALGVELQLLGVGSLSDLDRTFSAVTPQHAGALLVFPSPMFYVEHRRIVNLVRKQGMPAMYAFREAVEAGGLMSYGASIPTSSIGRLLASTRFSRGQTRRNSPLSNPPSSSWLST
jgi:putative ABC transport system substrate-binding protein